MLLELREHVGKKADLLPHAHRFHRYQRDAFARADRFDAGRMLTHFRADHGTFQFRTVRVLDQHRHARFAQRRKAARVQYLRASGSDFLCFFVIEFLKQARAGYLARIGGEHAGHVGPDFHALRFEQCTEIRGRRIRTATAEQHGAALRFARDETLRDEYLAELCQACIQRRIGLGFDHRRQQLGALVLVRQRHRGEAIACVQPLRGQARVGKEGRAQRARHQLAMALHQRRPRKLAHHRRAILGQFRQLAQTRRQGIRHG